MNEMTTLYEKKGSRYKVWGNAQNWYGRGDHDVMRAGDHRLTYCPTDGERRCTHDVTPDTAAFAAAAQIAQVAMEEAILKRSRAAVEEPSRIKEWTPQQRAIIEKFKEDMAATGALMPAYWRHATAHEIAKAGIDAVLEAQGQ
jgi:hypothetical protein